MTTETAVETAVEEAPEIEIVEAPEPEQLQDEPKEEAPKKTERVEFSTPEQLERFNDVYKQMKQSDNRNKMLTEFLMKQQEKLDELESRFTKTDESAAENDLMNKLRSARETGDEAAELLAIKELISFEKSKEEPKRTVTPTFENVDPDALYVADLMNERDDRGNFVRPYLQEGHPEHSKAIAQLATLAYKYKNEPDYIQKSLSELDQVMRKAEPQKRAPNPMQGSNLTNQKPRGTIKMTQAEITIARKLGIDPKRYAAQRDADIRGAK